MEIAIIAHLKHAIREPGAHVWGSLYQRRKGSFSGAGRASCGHRTGPLSFRHASHSA
jgi:hypothetical protein